MNISCSAEPCPVILDCSCVFYSGANLIYTGIVTNDTLCTSLAKIDQKFKDAAIGYVFQNGIIQAVPGGPVKLGGTLNQNTTITSGGYTFALTGTIESSAFITTGGTSSQFVKGDGSLDSTSYQPAGNYISALTGDGTATGPGSVPFTLATTGVLPNTYGSSTDIPILTIDSKGRITWATSIPFVAPPSLLIFSGDVTGAGYSNTTIPLTLATVLSTPGTYGGATTIPVVTVNAKGLVTGISQVSFPAGTGTVTSVGVSPGTGISASVANPTTTPVITITNTAPDQTVVLTDGAGINVTGTYPNFTIANTGILTVPDLQQVTTVGNETVLDIISKSVSGFQVKTPVNQVLGQLKANSLVNEGELSLYDIAAGPTTTYKKSGINNILFPTGFSGTFALSVNGYTPNSTTGDVTIPVGTGTVTAVTASSPLASSGGTTPNITIQQSSSSQAGYLSSGDWNTFNGKFDLPSLTAGSVLFSNGTTIAQDNANFFWDNATKRLGIGNSSPSYNLDVTGTGRFTSTLYADADLYVNNYFTLNTTATSEPSGYVGIWRRKGNGYGTKFLEDEQGGAKDKWAFIKRQGYNETRDWYNTNSSIVNINLGWGAVNQSNLSASTLLIDPVINIASGSYTGTKVRGIYYNPTLTSLTNTTHIAFENTSGDIIHGNLATGGAAQMVTADSTGKLGIQTIPSGSSGTVTSIATSGLISGGTITTSGTISTSMATNKLVGRSTAGTGVMEEITVGTGLSLSGGTLNSTSTGIPHATASGTDTYTAAVTGVTSYTDGDAYIIQFTNGNTTGCTLNINSIGAVTLYRNNDGALIGGDITAGGEMICVYDNTVSGFRVIGTSPNTLLAYVTNDDSVTITKGMPVYAFSGTGDRMTVKRALNTGDSTSAQTVGLVFSSSIAANQKGIIIMQGLLDGLSILPTATYTDGDAIYLGATAGTITNVKPYAPNHLVYLGFVTTASNGSAGRLYVRVQNGYELDELHNVQAQSPTYKDTLWYDNTVSPAQWKTASISTILGYTPQAALTLTTTGTSGAATLIANTLNIPQYAGATVGGSTGNIQYNNGTTFAGSNNLFWDNSNTRLGVAQSTPTSRFHLNFNQNSVTQSDANGILLANATAAIAGTQSISPAIVWQGNGWKTTATAASQDVRFRADVLPIEGTTVPNVAWKLSSSINGGAYVERMGLYTYSASGNFTYLDVQSSGQGQIRSGNIYANSKLGAVDQVEGGQSSATGTSSYKTTNAGGVIVPKIAAFTNVTAGTKYYGIDNTNGITLSAANASNLFISRAAIDITNLTNTAGGESGDLAFYTQQSGAAMTEKVRITASGFTRLTNGSTTLSMVVGTNAALNTYSSYRTTNAGSTLIPGLSTYATGVGAISYMIDGGAFGGNNGFVLAAFNSGSITVARAGINITNLGNTAGSESADMIFSTQSGGTAMSEKMRITGAGFVGVGITPVTKFQVDLTNTDYVNTSGANSHFLMTNPSATGQNVVASYINGALVAKWRTDYVGNISWVAGSTGAHDFYTGGDFGTGSIKMRIFNGGNVQIATSPVGGANADAGYKLDVQGTARVTGALNFNPTNTAAGTTGNQTINKASGTVNIAAAGTTVTVTNSLVTASSIVFAVIRTNDATATIKNVVPAAGSFVINLGAAATAETSIGFFVIN